MIKTTNKRLVDKYLAATRAHIQTVDTPEELRAFTNYRFMVALTDELYALGVPSALAARGAASVNVQLPENFHNDHEEAFVELIALWAKCIHVTYLTIQQDFHPKIVDEMVLLFCQRIAIELTF